MNLEIYLTVPPPFRQISYIPIHKFSARLYWFKTPLVRVGTGYRLLKKAMGNHSRQRLHAVGWLNQIVKKPLPLNSLVQGILQRIFSCESRKLQDYAQNARN